MQVFELVCATVHSLDDYYSIKITTLYEISKLISLSIFIGNPPHVWGHPQTIQNNTHGLYIYIRRHPFIYIFFVFSDKSFKNEFEANYFTLHQNTKQINQCIKK